MITRLANSTNIMTSMTSAELAAALAKLGLAPKDAAPKLLCSRRLVEYMLAGDKRIMPRTARLLDVLLAEQKAEKRAEIIRRFRAP